MFLGSSWAYKHLQQTSAQYDISCRDDLLVLHIDPDLVLLAQSFPRVRNFNGLMFFRCRRIFFVWVIGFIRWFNRAVGSRLFLRAARLVGAPVELDFRTSQLSDWRLRVRWAAVCRLPRSWIRQTLGWSFAVPMAFDARPGCRSLKASSQKRRKPRRKHRKTNSSYDSQISDSFFRQPIRQPSFYWFLLRQQLTTIMIPLFDSKGMDDWEMQYQKQDFPVTLSNILMIDCFE